MTHPAAWDTIFTTHHSPKTANGGGVWDARPRSSWPSGSGLVRADPTGAGGHYLQQPLSQLDVQQSQHDLLRPSRSLSRSRQVSSWHLTLQQPEHSQQQLGLQHGLHSQQLVQQVGLQQGAGQQPVQHGFGQQQHGSHGTLWQCFTHTW